MPVARAQFDDVCDLDAFICQMMDSVGVVPVEPEVWSCGLDYREALDDRIRIDSARWIAVFGNAPHRLDGRILCHETFDLIHVGAIFFELDGDHPDTVVGADFEMPVIAGDRTQKCNLPLL